MDVRRKNIGLSFYKGKWSLRVWAPDASTIQMRLSDSNVSFDLLPKAYGYWELENINIAGGDKYWLLLDGKQLPDPASVAQPEGVHGPSQAVALSKVRQKTTWKNIPLKNYIFYELHTGTFSSGGDFKGIAEHLDHLLDLGITAIEIMPVASFPGTRNWGYDGVFPFAVQHNYGGPAGLQELVALCHDKGLAVVLDVVYNHLGPEGNYLSEFGPYFTDKYKTPWGNAVNFDDQASHGVREFFVENALMWFRDFEIDALRLDAVHAIKDFSAKHILQEISRRTAQLSAETGKIHYLIAECDLNDPRYITGLHENGLGMHAQWVDEFHHTLRVACGEPRKGYYTDFNGVEHLGKSFKDAYVYTGMYSPERKNFFGRSAAGHPGHQFVVFSQNHDQVGNRMLGERSSVLFGFELQKLMAAAVLLSPFQPMLFMGEEWGERNPFQYFIDHTDPELVELVRNGRQNEFAAMHTSGEAPDPKAEETFLNSKLNWKLLKEQQHAVMFSFYKQLIALRKENPVLKNADPDSVRVFTYPEKNCLVVERGTVADGEKLVCFLNFSGSVQHLRFSDKFNKLTKVADSADPLWKGPIASPDNIRNVPERIENEISIPPHAFLAYSAFYA